MLFSPSEPSVRKRTCTSGRLTQTYSNADHIQTAPLDEQGLPRTAFYVPHCVGYLAYPFLENDQFFERMCQVASTGSQTF